MQKIPGARYADHTLALFRDPYRFISKRCRAYGSDVFQTRLLLQRTLCMLGRDAGELFCDPELFLRHGASPTRFQKTLLGVGGVQSLDGAAHTHRKQLLLSLMSPEQIHRIGATFDGIMTLSVRKWETLEHIRLYDELIEVLTRTVCAWAGVPLSDAEARSRAQDLSLMFDAAGAFGARHRAARHARARAEAWARAIVHDIRTAAPSAALRTDAAARIALHRDEDGRILDPQVAAVELLNVLRPTVAVSVYLVFVAHALSQHPMCREDLASDAGYVDPFIQEVRRFYPFFPAVPAVVRREFEWRGFTFPARTRVLLDLYGTNHDPRIWSQPATFRPERFKSCEADPYALIPQGAGVHDANHRCPGESITLELMKRMCHFLVQDITYQVPDQDLRIDFARLPALPHSRMVLREVRWIP